MKSTLRTLLVVSLGALIPPPVAETPPHASLLAPTPPLAARPGATDEEWGFVRERLARRASRLAPDEIDALASVVLEEARRYDMPVSLILAVIQVESAFNPFAVSPVGAMGLMQVLPSTGAEVAERLGVPWEGPRTLFDPNRNVRLGVAYLHSLRQRYGSVPVALAAYNWGPGRIDRRLRGGHPLPVIYASRVLGVYDRGFNTDS